MQLRTELNAQENPVFTPPIDDPNLPRVLLIGDSISIGYTLPVRRYLSAKANVHRVRGNCGPTTNGIQNLDAWLGDGKWDVIHFNFGLHDLKYIDEKGARVQPSAGRRQVSVADYETNLRSLLRRLSSTGANLIWCTTTPVPEGALGRVPGDEVTYNAAAERAIEGVAFPKPLQVNDLHQFAMPRLPRIQRKADVHFTRRGSDLLGKQVAKAIERVLPPRQNETTIARGTVFHDANGNQQFDADEKPLPGVRVSNGKQIVTTNHLGRYELTVDDDTILFVIKPRGWRTVLDEDNLPRFYYIHKPFGSPVSKFDGVAPTGPLPDSIDFPLYPQQEPQQFQAILFGDPQPRDVKEVEYIAHDVIEELIGTEAAFGVTLGDIVFDDLSVFKPLNKSIALLGIPWYNVIGNHDLNFDARDDSHSDETFERIYGPAYYSFDYGPVHFLVLDDVRC